MAKKKKTKITNSKSKAVKKVTVKRKPARSKRVSKKKPVPKKITRRKIKHIWPQEGTVIVGRIKGYTLKAEIIRDPEYRKEHGRAIRSLDNPDLPLARTMREAITLYAGYIQKKYNMKPIANAWKFWRLESDYKPLFDIPEYTRVIKNDS